MKVRLKVLTPIHIGSGESISPGEYFIDGEKGVLNVVNMETLFRDPGFERFREKYIKEAAEVRYLGKIVQDQNLLRKHVKYSVPITLEARNSNPIEIKSFIKTAGRPFIPGSSIKGAIISALVYFALKELYRSSVSNVKDSLNRIFNFRGKENDKEANLIGKEILKLSYNFLSKNKDMWQEEYSHLLDVSDSGPLAPAGSLRVELCRVQGARKGGQIPVFYETLKEGIETEFELTSRECRLEEKQIVSICHDFYLKVAQKDGVKIENQPYLVRLGQGGTVYSTSLLILAEELGFKNYLKKPPRTRKRLVDGPDQKAMGFARIELS